REDRVEESKRVAREHEAIGRTVPRAIAELTRDEVFTELLALAQVFLDPHVSLNLARHDRRRIFGIGEQVILIRDDADADDVVLQRNVPTPSADFPVSDGRISLVDSVVAFRSAVISPDREFVELRIFEPPAFARGRHLFAT